MEKQINAILKKVLKIDDSNFNDEISQNNYTDWDSIAHLELIAELEGSLKIRFTIDDILYMTNIKKVKERIKKKLSH